MLNFIFKFTKKDFLYLLCGSFILALGINLFIAPHNLAFGGITGITIILQSLFGLPIFVSNILLSIAVIIIGWLELGSKFMLKTVIPTLLLQLFLFLTEPLSTIPTTNTSAVILGAIVIGIGIGLAMYAGGSTAGPDTIGLILKKRFNIPITLTMIAIDISVILCGYKIYGTTTAIYSIIVAILMNITANSTKNILLRTSNYIQMLNYRDLISR